MGRLVTGPEGLTGLTLAVTSSTGVMGLAIGRVDQHAVHHLSAVEIATDRRHAEELGPRLQELLKAADASPSDLDRLVVDIGPGRFTGLRVGMATVRALSFALSRPVVGLTSLAVLGAGAAGPDTGPVTAVIDARRNEVFQQSFEQGLPIGDAKVGRPEDLAAESTGVVLGDGLDRYLAHYEELAPTGVTTRTGQNPDATVMLTMSQGLAGKPGTEVEPLYLRDPDANPNIKTRPVQP